MRLRPLAVLLLTLVLAASLTAGPASAIAVPQSPFSAVAPPGGNVTLIALGHLALDRQPVGQARFGNATFTLHADALEVSGPGGSAHTYANATLVAAGASLELTRPGSTLRYTLEPTVGLVTAEVVSDGPNGASRNGTLVTLRAQAGTLTVPGAPLVQGRLGAGGNVTLLSGNPASVTPLPGGLAGRNLTFVARGDVTVTAISSEIVLVPGSASVRVVVRPPSNAQAAQARALFAAHPQVEAACGELPPEQVREAFLQGGVLLRGSGRNATSLTASAATWRVDGCSYLRTREAVLTAGPREALKVEGSALWAYTESTFTGANTVGALGPIPFAVIAFWSVAGGAVLLRRLKPHLPPKEPPRNAARVSLLLHAGALAVSLIVWDQVCFSRYGASFGAAVWKGTLTLQTMQGLLLTEALPWALTVVAFGVPVYYTMRTLLLYFGCGKPYWGSAKAMGFIAAAIAGPAHLFFWLDLIASLGLARFF